MVGIAQVPPLSGAEIIIVILSVVFCCPGGGGEEVHWHQPARMELHPFPPPLTEAEIK